MQGIKFYRGRGIQLTVLMVMGLLIGWAGIGTSYATSYLQEKNIFYGKYPKGTKIYTHLTDPSDPRHLTFVVGEKGKGQFVQIQDQKQADYANIGYGYPIYSRHDGHYAYVAFKDGKARVVIDGKEQSRLFDAIDNVVLSSHGKRCAYRGQVTKGQVVVLDGKIQKKYPAVMKDTLTFSPDERHFAYVAYLKRGHMIVIKDNLKYGPYEYVDKLMFSPDSKSFVYRISQDKHWYLVKDGRKDGHGYDSISGMMFSPDSQHFVYSGSMGHKIIEIFDGNALKQFDGIGNNAFSPDSSRFIYMGKEGEKWRANGTSQPGPWQDIPSPLFFSPDSKTLIYYAIRNNKPTLVINGKEGETYDQAGKVVYSPDSKAWACRVRKGDQWHVVKNGVELKGYKLVRKPAFSPDSKHLAYTAVIEDNVMCVVEDEVEGNKYHTVNYPIFSPNSDHVAFAADKGKIDGKDAWVLVIDKKETKKHYDGFLMVHDVTYFSDKGVYAHCFDVDKGFFRVEAWLP